MFITACVLSGLLGFLLFSMTALAIQFVYFTDTSKNNTGQNEPPSVAVILPLRSPDPFLKRCLFSLANQDYPNYSVKIIVDNPNDPALETDQEVISETNSQVISYEFLTHSRDTCSLKNCALRQAFDSIDEDTDIIIHIDSDADPHSRWIEDLVTGFSDPSIGIVCGTRWFSPQEKTLPNLIRHIWNAGAILQMNHYQIGWGGAFAMKRELIVNAKLHQQWESTLFEDTHGSQVISDLGYKVKTIPRIAMVNEESISWKDCRKFIARQVLGVKLYHKAWFSICGHSLLAFFTLILSLGFIIFSAIKNDWLSFSIVAISLAIYLFVQATLTWLEELQMSRWQTMIGRKPLRLTGWKLLPAVPLTLIMYPICILDVIRTKTVQWRRNTYRISPNRTVRRVNYEPYVESADHSSESL